MRTSHNGVRIKICGISPSLSIPVLEATRGFDETFAIGVRIGRRRSAGELPPEDAVSVFSCFREPLFLPVVSTHLTRLGEILSLCAHTKARGAELPPCDPSVISGLKERGIAVFLALYCSRVKEVDRYLLLSPDFFVLVEDSFPPNWSRIAGIAERIGGERVLLGGWLHPGNVAYAVKQVLPYGINLDLDLFLRSAGDIKRLRHFLGRVIGILKGCNMEIT